MKNMVFALVELKHNNLTTPHQESIGLTLGDEPTVNVFKYLGSIFAAEGG